MRITLKGTVVLAALLLAAHVPAATEPLGSDWVIQGPGAWEYEAKSPDIIRQGRLDGASTAVLRANAAGSVWRCLVEPAPGTRQSGLVLQWGKHCSCAFVLDASEDGGGVALLDTGGNVLWSDRFAPWTHYTPQLLELVVNDAQVRVQMCDWRDRNLQAQSDWVALPEEPAGDLAFGLCTESGVARFYAWERVDEPLFPIVPDSPTKMRLMSAENSEWRVVGGGDWRWTSAEKRIVRQNAPVERTTAINTEISGSEGTWQCRVRPERGVCGAGMLLLTDREAKTGFMVWLGGTYGAGALMLYRIPLQRLWSGAQDQWHYETEYVLEGTIEDGMVSARMLAADGATVIAASPEFPLTDEEKERIGFVAFQTWRGTAQFWDFSDETRAEAAVASAPKATAGTDLGHDWQAVKGEWIWSEDGKALISASDEAAALWTGVNGARGVYRCRVTPGKDTQSVLLMFQVSPDLQKGFTGGVAWRPGATAFVEQIGDRDLWSKGGLTCTPGKSVILEGRVLTDRIAFRVLDQAGTVLATSEDRYVSETNNTRQGHLGIRATGGSASFSDFSFDPGGE